MSQSSRHQRAPAVFHRRLCRGSVCLTSTCSHSTLPCQPLQLLSDKAPSCQVRTSANDSSLASPFSSRFRMCFGVSMLLPYGQSEHEYFKGCLSTQISPRIIYTTKEAPGVLNPFGQRIGFVWSSAFVTQLRSNPLRLK